MSYTWKPDLIPGADADTEREAAAALDRQFEDQMAAEEWLTDSFRGLLAKGVQAVTLYEEERVVYGPMSLEA